MDASKLTLTVQTLALTIFSSLSLNLHAGEITYQIEKAEYINSAHASVEALCNPGDELVEGSCEGSYRNLSPRGIDVDYPLDSESVANGYRCKPRTLRADQIVMVVVELTCKTAKTARIAGVQ